MKTAVGMQFAAVGSPNEPTLSLPKKDRRSWPLPPRLPTHFIPLCKTLFACVREHGTDVLQLAPVPFHPLPEEQQQPLLRALRDAEQRTYLDYVCRWQDAMLSQAPVCGTRNQAALRNNDERYGGGSSTCGQSCSSAAIPACDQTVEVFRTAPPLWEPPKYVHASANSDGSSHISSRAAAV